MPVVAPIFGKVVTTEFSSVNIPCDEFHPEPLRNVESACRNVVYVIN
jgi:hypothetical protein